MFVIFTLTSARGRSRLVHQCLKNCAYFDDYDEALTSILVCYVIVTIQFIT